MVTTVVMQEIRIEISSSDFPGINPSLVTRVAKCPVPGLVGSKDNVQINMPRGDLIRLRGKPAQPDLQFLRNIGGQIRQTLGPTVWAAIQASRQITQDNKLRITIYAHPSAIRELGQAVVRADEIPIELVWDPNDDFCALNIRTPVIRGLSIEPDRPIQNIAAPLKILVVISTPRDKPRSSMEKEKEVMQQALQKKLADEDRGTGGIIWIRWCMPGTKSAFEEMLKDFNPHVVHFIGHGGFDTIQEGQAAQGYLCFKGENNDDSDPMTADDLAVLLRNTSTPVGLFVMTACSSAQAAPLDPTDLRPYDILAFEGIAQKLVAGISGITAAVAMQFDIEEDAAVEFTRTFYSEFIKPNTTIEEIVTRARIAVSRRMTTAHPSWVSPVLFSRSTDGIIFNLQHPTGDLTPDEKSELAELEREIRAYRYAADRTRETISTIPVEMRAVIIPQLMDFLERIEQTQLKRSKILGNSLRVSGKRIQKNTDIELSVSLHIRTPANVDRIQFDIQYAGDALQNAAVRAGQDTPTVNPVANSGPGINDINVMLIWPHGNFRQFDTGEYEIAKLAFHVSPTAPSGFAEIRISIIGIYGNNRLLGNRGIAGTLFVED
jgi:hypothetical protein